MRTVAFPLVLSLALVVGAPALATTPQGQSLVDLETKWSKAFVTHDTAFMSQVMGDDWAGENGGGKTSDKTHLIGLVKSGKLSITHMTNHDVRARIFGDIAVVQGMDDETSTYDGKDTSGTYIWTDVFQKRGGRWVAVASQTGKVDAKP